MNFSIVLSIFLFCFIAAGQGIYSDYGINRIYCFTNEADIELELIQNDNVIHTFSAEGGDIHNITERVTVGGVPNGVSFYLSNEKRSTIVVILDDEENVIFEGLSDLTGTKRDFHFECEFN